MTDTAVPATLVWASPEPPSATAARALAAWARAHGVVLTEPSDAPLRAVGIEETSATSLAIANEVGELLDRAEDALAAHEADAVERALDAAETRLRAHAALPQAAWLMAEVERARSARWRRVPPVDVQAADRAWERAEAIDGGRVAGIGEQASAARAPAVTLAVIVPADDRVRIDGHALAQATPIETHAGAHAVVVSANDQPVWAGWIDAEAGRGPLALDAPAIAPCSSADVSRGTGVDGARFGGRDHEKEQGARRSARARLSPERVRCARWIVAEVAGDGPDATRQGVRLATCEAGRCSEWREWREWDEWGEWDGDARWSPSDAAGRDTRAVHEGSAGTGNPRGRPQLPDWAIWTLGGVAAAGLAVVAVVASGVLQAAPTETRFVNGGLKTQ